MVWPTSFEPEAGSISGAAQVIALAGASGNWALSFDEEFNDTTVDANKWATNWFGGTNMSSTIYNWPAWWTDGHNWPQDGEADIFGTIPGSWANGYHTYGIYRQAGTNYVYWDGILVRSYPTYDNGAPQYLLLTNGAGNTALVSGAASYMKVGYVRVWKAN